MLKKIASIAAMLLTCIIAGCGGSPAPSGPGQVGAGPHNGVVVPIGAAGVAEILNETRSEKVTKRGHPPVAIAVYFLQADLKTALTPAPTEVSIKLASDTEPTTIPLSPATNPKDPASSARFSSPTGAYDLSGIQGELTAKVGGETITQPFQGPR